ncbi:hypothetical protein CSB11_00775 [Candidatus Campbellbacteria bacterium]|nr:MAG: hypothetical protein CSB11_00775 [Candidatus Campbellbacteria bacterium]
MNKQEIKKCKHTKENKLFGFGAFVTLLILSILFTGSFFRTEIFDEVKDQIITDYKTEHNLVESISDEEILKKVDQEDQEFLGYFDYYYWFVIVLLPLAFFLMLLFMIGKMYGKVRANSVRLNKHQYPEVHKIFKEMSKELGFEETPELYLVNGNGALNAYATCVPGFRNFSAIYSDVLERCLKNNDMETLRFILGHELGHLKFNHIKWWYSFLTLWMNLPGIQYLFGLPLSRSRELGCDKIGQKLSKNMDGRPLMILSAGKYAYQDIDMEKYTKEHFEKKDFWAWISNFFSDHGNISWRIAAVRKKHQAGLFFKNKKDNTKK